MQRHERTERHGDAALRGGAASTQLLGESRRDSVNYQYFNYAAGKFSGTESIEFLIVSSVDSALARRPRSERDGATGDDPPTLVNMEVEAR